MLWLLFLACTSSEKGGTDTSGPEDSAGLTWPDEDWTGVVACSDVRLLAANGTLGLAIELELDVYQAVVSGETVDTELSVGAGAIIVMDEGIQTGDVCGSTEEFPFEGSAESYWYGVSGTLTATFVPDEVRKAGGDWSYDGTELGTLTVSGEDLRLEANGDAVGDWEISKFNVSARLSVIDLPA